MARSIRAVYENGVLRPLDELDMAEGQEVELIVQTSNIDERLLEQFTRNLQGMDIDQFIEEAKADSTERILGQGAAQLALLLSDLIVEAMMSASIRPGKKPEATLEHQSAQ